MNLSDSCLISKEQIEHKITLTCKHSFEYFYLFQEIIQQKKRHPDYFKCPYCRVIYNGTIPYYEIEDVEKMSWINYNHKTLLPILKCVTCGDGAHSYKTGIYCINHYQTTAKPRCTSLYKNKNKCSNYAIHGDKCNKHYTQMTPPPNIITLKSWLHGVTPVFE